MNRNPCNGDKDCPAKGCCLNCTNYHGSMEFIPTVLNINCHKRKGVILKLHGYPEINGKADTDCREWRFYEGKKINARHAG